MSIPIEKVRLDRSRHAAPQVAEHLRDAILSLELPPGTVLARAELAEQFGISQTPIRDALLQLDAQGLVDIYPQHATVVSRIDVQAAQQAHFLRRSIELEIVRELALHADKSVLTRLEAQLDVQRECAAAKDYAAFAAADREFHRIMYEASGLLELQLLVERMSGHVDRLRRLHLPTAGKSEAILRDHTAILRALRRHDPAAAQDALRHHLSGTLAALGDICERYPDYLTTGGETTAR